MDDPGMQPLYDAVGRALVAASLLEFWFNLLASGLTGDEASPEVRKLDRRRRKNLVLKIAETLDPADQAAVEEVAEKVWELMGTRDAIVHGAMGATDGTGEVLYCWRAPLGNEEFVVDPRWPDRPYQPARVQTFRRPQLLEYAAECRATWGRIQSNSGRWDDQAARARGETYD